MRRRKAICLNMIVKNETANLQRCLEAVAPHIDCWVVCDTGSTDGTQDAIARFFDARGIPGELHSFPFLDFAQARNEALKRARLSSLRFDYFLLTDADMELMVSDRNLAEKLSASAYRVLQKSGLAYWNVRLLDRNAPAAYKGVTHEFLNVESGKTASLEGLFFVDHASGGNRAEKYDRDVRLLTAAMAEESDPGMIARYTFYLANTYRDSGRLEDAMSAYLRHSRLGKWVQEVFLSLFNAARIAERLGRPDEEVIAGYEAATNVLPTRAEALHGAAKFCRIKAMHERGYEFARRGLALTYPKEALFVPDWIYDYGLLDELAVNAYWCGRFAECIQACDRLLSEGKLPPAMRDRIENNRDLAVGKIKEAKAPPAPRRDEYLELLQAARERAGRRRGRGGHCG